MGGGRLGGVCLDGFLLQLHFLLCFLWFGIVGQVLLPVVGAVLSGLGHVLLEIAPEVVQRFDFNSEDLYVEFHDLSERIKSPFHKVLPRLHLAFQVLEIFVLALELALDLVDGVVDVGQAQLVLLAEDLAHFCEVLGVFVLFGFHELEVVALVGGEVAEEEVEVVFEVFAEEGEVWIGRGQPARRGWSL